MGSFACMASNNHHSAHTPTGKVLHLMVAAKPVARTRYAGPSTAFPKHLMPAEGLALLDAAMSQDGEPITTVAISGPGDPLATPEVTLSFIREIKARYPHLTIGLRTYGLGSEGLATRLAEAGVTHVELLVDGVRKEILEKLYAWIRPGSKTLKLSEGVSILLAEQRSGVSALTFHGIHVSIITTLYPGFNIDHTGIIAEEMLELGAQSMALIPYKATPGAEVKLVSPSEEERAMAAQKASTHLPLCEAYFTYTSPRAGIDPQDSQTSIFKPSLKRPHLAVTSMSGMEVDLHLGHAEQFLIYGRREDGLCCLLEARQAPLKGTGDKRWQNVAETLADCFMLITESAGEKPKNILAEQGLHVYTTDDEISGLVDAIFNGNDKKKKKKMKE